MRKELELYLHIPFCVQKCGYCDFLSAAASPEEYQTYVESMRIKIRSYRELAKKYYVTSIFVGGGTPSVLSPKQTELIFDTVYDTFSVDKTAEITTEMNPGTVTGEKLVTYRKLGINRLSIGLQSANNHELRMLGRIHTYEDFIDTYVMARNAGFDNINVDLMAAIPHQSVESYENTLLKTAALEPEHISAYSLIIEEGTPFYQQYGEGRNAKELPDEEEERLMYEMTREILGEYGYSRYEISNYAKKGCECRHNLGYWERKEYLGIGKGASSLIDNTRFTEGEQPRKLSIDEQMEEFMFLGLRMMEGISKERFLKLFGKSVEEVYGCAVEKLCKEHLLLEENGFLKLTDRGIDISNYCLSEFLF